MRTGKRSSKRLSLARGAAILALGLVAVVGCEFITFTTNSPGGDEASPGRAKAAPNDGSPDHPEEMAKRFKTAFDAFGLCSDHCGMALLERANIRNGYGVGTMSKYVQTEERGNWYFNPVHWMDNPDPEWLTGWGDMIANDTFHTKVVGAVALAANRKAWQARCYAQFDENWAKHQAREKTLRPKLEDALKDADPQQRIRRLLEVRAASDEYETVPTLPQVGVWYEIEKALAEQVKSAEVEVVFFGRKLNRGSRFWRARHPRALYSEEEERTLACGNRSDHPTAESSESSQYVKDVVDQERLETLNDRARVDEKAAVAAATIAEPKVLGSTHKLVVGKKLKTATDGSERVLRYSEVVDAEIRKCRETKDKVMRVSKNGTVRVENDTACWGKPIKRTIESTVSIPVEMLPDGIELRQGDELIIFGVQDPGSKEQTQRLHSWDYDVQHIAKISRGGAALLQRW